MLCPAPCSIQRAPFNTLNGAKKAEEMRVNRLVLKSGERVIVHVVVQSEPRALRLAERAGARRRRKRTKKTSGKHS